MIFIAFVAMGLVTGALGAYGLFVLSAAKDFVADTYDRSLMAVSFARAASLDFARMDKELLQRSIAAPQEQAAIDERLDKLAANFAGDLAVVEERALGPDERDEIRDIRALAERWTALRKRVSAPTRATDAVAEQIIERLDMLIELTADHSFVARRKAVMSMQRFTYSSIAATLLGLALSAAITWLLARRIIRPLAAAAAIANRIAEGALDTPIPPGGADETGVLLRSMTVMQDNIRIMVEREQAQRRSAQNRLIEALESSHEAIALVDADGRIVIANSQLDVFFPMLAGRLGGETSFADAFRGLGGLVAADADETDETRWSELLSAGSEFRLADGRWLRVARSRTQDGGFFLVLSDLSDIKEREERLSEARRQAEAASAAKSNFLANISHELRTPLNAIIGFSEILSGEMFGALGHPKYHGYAANICDSGKHLLGIINSVLDLTNSLTGRLQLAPETVDLNEIVEDCAAAREDCERAGLTLTTTAAPAPLLLWADQAKLRQVLANLLSNAVKFTEPGGSVAVSVALEAEDSVVLRVADTGIGMSAEDIPIALAPFGQVDSRFARRYEGTGLGLPLAKALVELHGGQIAIDSMPGKGTSVRITLPRMAGAAVPDDAPRVLDAAAPG
ncbi:MAG TPA: ATP-binding protein [Stellaceae bacterium]|nr:ATP-binding protein [Stellaceae bacterium]